MSSPPGSPEYRHDAAAVRSFRGKWLAKVGELAAAEVECRTGLAAVQKLVREDTHSVPFRAQLATCHQTLGGVLSDARTPRR